MLFSTVAAPVHIPAKSARGFPFFPHPCQYLLFVVFLRIVILTGGFDLHFFDD